MAYIRHQAPFDLIAPDLLKLWRNVGEVDDANVLTELRERTGWGFLLLYYKYASFFASCKGQKRKNVKIKSLHVRANHGFERSMRRDALLANFASVAAPACTDISH